MTLKGETLDRGEGIEMMGCMCHSWNVERH